MSKLFSSEADLVTAFCDFVDRTYNTKRAGYRPNKSWTIYHETGGFDALLVQDETGVQIGVEAKLSLNAKVLDQVLPSRGHIDGPDYRAVLVPTDGIQAHMMTIALQVGVQILGMYDMNDGHIDGPFPKWWCRTTLPDETFVSHYHDWFSWLPERRVALPGYVPDVVGGKAAPVALTAWKITAIKLLILLDRTGFITRADMRALNISPTRWTAASYGYLKSDARRGHYLRCDQTPDLRIVHPVNYAQIEADYETWVKDVRPVA